MKKKIKYPNIVRGGYAIPIYENMFLLKGKTHEEGGIDLGSTIEAENNEVLQINKNNIKVFSSVPFLNGNSPAELVLGGANPNDVFNAQEAFKDRNNLNDDGTTKARNGILKRIRNKVSNIYWHTLRAPKDYSDDKATLRNGKTTVECAKWANDALQGQGLSIFGDAWTRSSNKGIKKVYSGYNRKARPTQYDEAAVEQYVFNAADSLAKTMDLSKLQTNDIVGLYFRNSPNKETAYRNGTNGEAQTHTGNIVVEDGVPYVVHNVHGELIKNKAEDLIGSNHPYGIVSVYRKEFSGMKQYRNGGLSRSKDYGSSKKPYPNVKSSEFAGGNRSYPIPTKADAVDALRLAGLHGRSDVKAKVYKKYPELRKRKDLGGEEDLIRSGIPQRELDETYRQYSGAIQRNVPLPTGRAVALTDNAQILFDNRLKQHIEQTAERNRRKRKKSGADYTPLVLNGIGALGNIGGNIASSIINGRMIDELEYAPEPTPLLPTKLKTKININPQLQRLYTDLGLMTDAVNNNTASSRTALVRNQRLRNQTRQAVNELYGNKENVETQLINRDRLNQQQVALNNILQYNRWRQGLADFNNELANLRAENRVATTQGIVGAISDFLTGIGQNNLEARNLSYLQQSNPYAIDALSPEVLEALNRGNGYIRLGKCGGRFKSKKK